MHKAIFAAFVGFVSIGLSPLSFAQPTVAEACASFERPNIDCACVASRAAVYERISTDDARPLIAEGYLYALGLDDAYDASMAAYMGDPMAAMLAEELYDKAGGRPENITDYEEGCVIAGALPLALPIPTEPAIAGEYVAACTAATGNERFCACDAVRKTSRISDLEFEAYFRSFSDFSDSDATTSTEMTAARAEKMDISPARFDSLQSSARNKMSEHETEDNAYCSAVTWADDELGVDAETRLEAGFEPGLVGRLAPQSLNSSVVSDAVAGPLEKARAIVATACTNDGNSDQYCTCYKAEFESEVVAKAASPSITLAWAVMANGSSGMATSEQVTLMQSISQADNQAAAMMFMETMDIGKNCTQGPAAAAPKLTGTPRERMLKVCIAENEDEALCDCMVTKMEAQFNPDDFELMVDIREAEYRGAEDAFAEVAAERGLSVEEAEQALMNNPAIIGASMGMGAAMMQCMGGMPQMPAFPGMPDMGNGQ
ncbi:MAG: hypothetical protein AAGI14_08230 [Pseudomonadota bacterium]